MDTIRGIEEIMEKHAIAIHDLRAKSADLLGVSRLSPSTRADKFVCYGGRARAIGKELNAAMISLDCANNLKEEHQSYCKGLSTNLVRLIQFANVTAELLEQMALSSEHCQWLMARSLQWITPWRLSQASSVVQTTSVNDTFKTLTTRSVYGLDIPELKSGTVDFNSEATAASSCDRPPAKKARCLFRGDPPGRPRAKSLVKRHRPNIETSTSSMSSMRIPGVDELRKQELALDQERQAFAREQLELESARKRLDVERLMQANLSGGSPQMPCYWRTVSLDEASFIRCETSYLLEHIREVLQARSCSFCPVQLSLLNLKIERVENTFLWKSYCGKRRDILERHRLNTSDIDPIVPAVRLAMHGEHKELCNLEDAVNETYLLHGVRGGGAVADAICREGFDPRIANIDGLYGAGVYFADQACKALQYARGGNKSWTSRRYIFYSRVTLGRAFPTRGDFQNQRRPPRGFDSVVAHIHIANHGVQRHREFVVYDGSQIYPEFLISFDS